MKYLDLYFDTSSPGAFYRLRSKRADGTVNMLTLALAYTRGARPRLSVVAKCRIVEGEQKLMTLCSRDDGRLWFMTSAMVARGVLAGCHDMDARPRVTELTLSDIRVRHCDGSILIPRLALPPPDLLFTHLVLQGAFFQT